MLQGFFGDVQQKSHRIADEHDGLDRYKNDWTLEEEEKLRASVILKQPLTEICYELKRPLSSVSKRMEEMVRRYKRINQGVVVSAMLRLYKAKKSGNKVGVFDVLKYYLMNQIETEEFTDLGKFHKMVKKYTGQLTPVKPGYLKKRKAEALREIKAEEGEWCKGIEEKYFIPYKRKIRRRGNGRKIP